MIINGQSFKYDEQEKSREVVSDMVNYQIHRITYLPYLKPKNGKINPMDFSETNFANSIFYKERDLIKKMSPSSKYSWILNLLLGLSGGGFIAMGIWSLDQEDMGSVAIAMFSLGGTSLLTIGIINWVDAIIGKNTFHAMKKMADKHSNK